MLKKIELIVLVLLLWTLLYGDSMKHDSYLWVYVSLSFLLISWKYLYSITEFWIRYVHRNEMSPFGCLLSSDPYSFHLQRHLWKLPASHAIGVMFWKSKKSTLCAFIEWTVHLFACVFVCSIPLPFRCVR